MSAIPPLGANPYAFFHSQNQSNAPKAQPEEQTLVDQIQKSGGFKAFVKEEQEKALFLRALNDVASNHVASSLEFVEKVNEALSSLDLKNSSIDEIKEKLKANLDPEVYAELMTKIEEFIEREIKEKTSDERAENPNGTFSTLV